MRKIQIKLMFSDKVLFEGNYESTAAAVVDASNKGAHLQGADLRGAYLRGAHLQGAHLQGAHLQGADLQGAYLRGAHLQGAHLQGAHLQGADLQGADLRGADLRGAYLRGAHLQGAHLQGEKLEIAPLQILNLRWDVLISPAYMVIGCQRHSHVAWAEFERTEITPMAGKAWDWWKEHKNFLMAACALHAAAHKKAQARND